MSNLGVNRDPVSCLVELGHWIALLVSYSALVKMPLPRCRLQQQLPLHSFITYACAHADYIECRILAAEQHLLSAATAALIGREAGAAVSAHTGGHWAVCGCLVWCDDIHSLMNSFLTRSTSHVCSRLHVKSVVLLWSDDRSPVNTTMNL